MICGGTRLTYRDLLDRLERLHTVLGELDTRPGDRVAVLAFNSIPFMELYCGIPACGRAQVPLNFRWAVPVLEYALSDSGARILVTDRDPGRLGELVDRVIRIDDGEYDGLVAAAAPLIAERGLTLVGFAVSNIDRGGAQQLELPFEEHADTVALDGAVDEVRKRYGNAAVTRGVLVGRDPGLEMPHLPD